MATRVQQRRDTAANWASINPILMEGELGFVSDSSNNYKIGDGINAWNSLPLQGFDGTVVQETGNSTTSVMSQAAVSSAALINNYVQVLYRIPLLDTVNSTLTIPSGSRIYGLCAPNGSFSSNLTEDVVIDYSSLGSIMATIVVKYVSSTEISYRYLYYTAPVNLSDNEAVLCVISSGYIVNGIFTNYYRNGTLVNLKLTEPYATQEDLTAVQTSLNAAPFAYNMSTLYPTEGIDGTSRYDLATAINVLASKLSTSTTNISSLEISFNVSNTIIERYVFLGATISTTTVVNNMYWRLLSNGSSIKESVELTLNIGSYVTSTGVIASHTGYCYSDPIYLTSGTLLYIGAGGSTQNVGILSKTDEGGSYRNVILASDNLINNYGPYYMYLIEESSYYIVSGASGLVVHSLYLEDSWRYIQHLSNSIKSLQEEIEDPIDIDLVTNTTDTPIYGFIQDSEAFNFLNRLYVEGLATTTLDGDLEIDRMQSVPIYSESTSEDVSLNFPIYYNGDKIGSKTINLLRKPVSNLQNRNIRIMAIGDSITEGYSGSDQYGYCALVDFIFRHFNSKYNDINVPIFVGTKDKDVDKNVTLGEETYTGRAFSEGRSSWNVADFLRHFKFMYTSTHSSLTTLSGKAAWDSLGLGSMTRNGIIGRTYVDWVSTTETKKLINDTCHGYYDADPSEELWTYLKYNLPTFTLEETTYSFSDEYTTDDDSVQKCAIRYLCHNPANPFFDLDTVEDSEGEYAFSMSKYLSRYRTMSDEGIRLTADLGELVTDSMQYDVCVPTHVCIIMNTNSYNTLGTEYVQVVEELSKIAYLIKSYDNSINIIIGTTRPFGVLNQNRHSIAGVKKYSPTATSNQRFVNTYEYLVENKQSYFDVMPLYLIQNPYSVNCSAIDTSYPTDELKWIDTIDYSHNPSRAGDYLDRAIQLASWINYSLG